MLLQHASLQYYKPPPPPSSSTTKHMSSPPVHHHQSVGNNSVQAFKASCNTRAMRYYRLWIYTCNAVLLVSVLGFAVVAGRIVVADSRRYLVPGLSLYQPSFLYAYLALATQSGLLQLVGCLGALRLNERLLNVYWLLLLVLLFGDAIVGIVWVFRFDKICADLRPTLKQRLAAEYGVDTDFTTLWNALQRDYKCCGVEGVQDFDGAVVNRTQGVPEKNEPMNHVISPEEEADTNRPRVYTTGCEGRLLFWLRQSADVLFVLGYCVIAFLKLCFLGILRYEIREMIQKIKVLQGEMRPPQLLLTDFETGASPITSPATTTQHLEPLLLNHHENNNGNIVTGTNGGTTFCLQTTPLHHVSAQHQRHLSLINNDEDHTGSSKPTAGKTKQTRGSNGNNNYELHELQELNRLLASLRSHPNRRAFSVPLNIAGYVDLVLMSAIVTRIFRYSHNLSKSRK
ncbi:hypothetical protein L9F63_026671, partial [Diploptera punctata]